MHGTELSTALRELVRQAQNTGPKLNLTQIAQQCDVNYGRLWRFMRESDVLQLDEGQRIYEVFTGQKLLPTLDDAQ